MPSAECTKLMTIIEAKIGLNGRRQGRTIGFCRGGRGKIFHAQIFCCPPPPLLVWEKNNKRGGQTFVTFIHHDLVICVVLSYCIFSKTVSPNKHTEIKWWYLSISTSRLNLGRLRDKCMETGKVSCQLSKARGISLVSSLNWDSI